MDVQGGLPCCDAEYGCAPLLVYQSFQLQQGTPLRLTLLTVAVIKTSSSPLCAEIWDLGAFPRVQLPGFL